MTRHLAVICSLILSSCGASHPSEQIISLDLSSFNDFSHTAVEIHNTANMNDVALQHAYINTITTDGVLLVADTYKNRIIAFNRDLDILSTFGGSGVGPGEFQEITSLTLDSSDSIIVYDRRLNRISIFGRSAVEWNYGRSEPLNSRTSDLFNIVSIYKISDGSFFTIEDELPASIEKFGKVFALRRFVVREGDSLSTIYRDRGLEFFKRTEDGATIYGTVPFARQMMWRLDRSNHLHVLHWSDRIEVTKFTLSGDSISSVFIEAKPVSLSSNDLSQVADRLTVAQLALVSDERQLVNNMVLSSNGTYWFELETADVERRTWIEINEAGDVLKSLLLDRNSRLLQVYEDLLFAQSRNQFDEPMLTILRLEPLN